MLARDVLAQDKPQIGDQAQLEDHGHQTRVTLGLLGHNVDVGGGHDIDQDFGEVGRNGSELALITGFYRDASEACRFSRTRPSSPSHSEMRTFNINVHTLRCFFCMQCQS